MKVIKFSPLVLLIIVFLIYSCNSDLSPVGNGASLFITGTVLNSQGFPVYPSSVSINYEPLIDVNPDGTFSTTVNKTPYNIIVYTMSDTSFTYYRNLSNLSPIISLRSYFVSTLQTK